MKKIFSIFLMGLFLAMFSGCEKWLDVNDNINVPTSASPELVLPVAELSVATVVGGYYNLLGGFWSQFWTQSSAANQYKYIDSYTINATDFWQQWTEMYAGGLNDLEIIRADSEAEEDWSMYLMATVMKCYAYQVLADLYGQVPYFEACQGQTDKNFNPAYNTGQEIYDDLIIQLDNALAKDYELTERAVTTDFLFEGDMDSWVAFANTLKLKIYMRQSVARASVAQSGIQGLYSAGAPFLSTHAGLDIFIDERYADNPLYAANNRNLNVATNLRASVTFYNYLDRNGDSRFDYYFLDGASTVPMPQGGFNISSTVVDPTTVTVFALYPTTPVNLISAAESYFLQAEAVIRGWGTGDAKALYDMGVQAAFTACGMDGSSYIAAGGVYEYPAGTAEENIKAVLMQKWISLAGVNGIEAFFETNRTGVPGESDVEAWVDNALNPEFPGGAFTYSLEGVTGAGNYPKRLLIPQTERAANTSVPAEMKTKTVTDKVWWAK